MKQTILSLALLVAFAAGAQSNKEAQKLLNEVKAKTKAYKTQTINFVNEIDAPTGNPNQPRSSRKTRGIAKIKGNKYRIEMGGFFLINTGKKAYMVYPDDEEINVVNTAEQQYNLTPEGILSSYDKGFSMAMAGKETINGKTIQYIRLKPKAAADVKEIIIGINMATKQLYSYKQFSHDDVITTLTVEKYVTNTALSDDLFSIDTAEFKDFEVYEE